jgi:hypothetical protein
MHHRSWGQQAFIVENVHFLRGQHAFTVGAADIRLRGQHAFTVGTTCFHCGHSQH